MYKNGKAFNDMTVRHKVVQMLFGGDGHTDKHIIWRQHNIPFNQVELS
jgi:hypothetical protein